MDVLWTSPWFHGCCGQANKEIAAELFIAEDTVKNHIKHIYDKIGRSSRAGAALFAMGNDLIRT